LFRTSDGGRHFDRLPAAPAANVRFADSRDGFAFGSGTPLYVTHDGGRRWRPLAVRGVLDFAAAGGTAYAVTDRCARNGSCGSARFERSSVSRDAWRSAPMPFGHADPNFALAAHGAGVWVFGAVSNAPPSRRNVLARSTDHGRTFATGLAPCYAELSAELDAVSSRVVWAFCPTGLQGIAWRSTNGGATFEPLRIPHCCANSTSLGAVSETVAVLSGNAAGTHLLRTTDGGATWRLARTPAEIVDWGPFDFVDASTGFSLVSVGRVGRVELLRTTDAGMSWHAVSIR
jgi:photosystem II stability/assembly factor-like uncharacterized protein